MHYFKLIILFLVPYYSVAQPSALESINAANARTHLEWLASDSLEGRGNGTALQLLATRYIGQQFADAGLQPLPGETSYYIPFSLNTHLKLPAPVSIKWNQSNLSERRMQWFGRAPLLMSELNLADFTIIQHEGAFTEETLLQQWSTANNILLWTTTPFGKRRNYFPKKWQTPANGLQQNILLVCFDDAPQDLQVKPNPTYLKNVAFNVAAWIPGKKWPDEKLIFSAHYDHLGLEGKGKDRIMNGANDNASGTTALLMLANYFAQTDTASRSLVFMAFAGEEMGLLGSYHQAAIMNTKEIKGMLNLEMLAIPQYGINKVFFTGWKHSSLPRLLEHELEELGIEVIEEPDEENMLFERSDNFPFALKGVPAHTIMASDDQDPCYHLPCDESSRVDFENLARITRALALAVDVLMLNR